ncbi:MAG TPA: 3-deoxy-7-phosphoheptulonate synthase [Candidatus Fraserbacteria bacterium]|nr:3-deoxy-7-phosphoheptulonate synthase [Candidatus Fraserbacteria bacterium]
MVIVMEVGAAEEQIAAASNKLIELGFQVHRIDGVNQSILGAIGDKRGLNARQLEILPGVREIVEITKPYKLASREFKPDDTVIRLGGVSLGGRELVLMAGPCSVESEEQIETIAQLVAAQGGKILRGGAFKPRTSPYSFQGLGEDGLKLLRQAADAYGLLTITEVMDSSQVELVAQYADIFQIGARNMQNYSLLRAVGRSERPVLLKRGLAATIDEWLMAAEYILSEGNYQVILCERGIRTFSDYNRFTLDLGAIPVVKRLSHLPVIVDPSHAAGLRERVLPLARAAIAAGADGLIVETHNRPDEALSDGPQALLPEQLAQLSSELATIGRAVGRVFEAPVLSDVSPN